MTTIISEHKMAAKSVGECKSAFGRQWDSLGDRDGTDSWTNLRVPASARGLSLSAFQEKT